MLKNYIKIAFRNLLRFRIYSLINLFGLSLGLTVGVLILLYIIDETGYDEFHVNSDKIYKVVTQNPGEGLIETNAWPVVYKLKNEYPEVDKYLYTRKVSSGMMINYEGKRYEHDMYFASEDFFNIFSFDLLEGTASTALVKPNTIVITDELKKKYFASGLVLGKTITLMDSLEFEITGVVYQLPTKSHIQFDALISFATFEQSTDFNYESGWGNFNVRNYILLHDNANINELSSKAAGMYMDASNAGDRFRELGMEFNLAFIPLSDIYLISDAPNGFGPKGSIDKVYLVAGIALFVILLACINFINLTTARSVYRAKEVGLRKVVGSTRSSLFWQFMSESLVITIIAFGIVLFIIDLILPFFNELMSKNYDVQSLFNINVILSAISLVLIVALFAGYYPAMVLSGFKPTDVLKGRMQGSRSGVQLRRILVVFQFFISATLVLGTLLILNQLDYMRNQDLGFDKEQVLILDATRVPRSASHKTFKDAMKSLANVTEVSYNNAIPGKPGWQGQWAYPEKIFDDGQVTTEYMAIDENYIHALGLKLIAGRNFDVDRPVDLEQGLLINETTVMEMGWRNPENAIGKKIVSPSGYPEGTVIGVVKDYHGQGLQEVIWPKVMDYSSDRFGRYYAIKFTTDNTSEIIENARNHWKESLGDYQFEYSFLNEDFDRQYQSEDQLMHVFTIFAILTIIIAGIGLLGLVSFMVLSRTKEIGIRKVLGADVMSITKLLSKEFVVLVVVANLIAMPLVWYFGEQWLENFAYHMEINPVIFFIALLISVVLAIIIVSFQTIKAALMSPVDTLKGE